MTERGKESGFVYEGGGVTATSPYHFLPVGPPDSQTGRNQQDQVFYGVDEKQTERERQRPLRNVE